ncbi:cellulose binding domain-containing protein [Micromonospora sp. FIMYZ51]|uniref:cellulose binding domain-containing protein n=1 Tax=Micromonospora sp. FIMYZ51 TaxID=3051832 RepID=UPI00311EAC14
MSGMRRAPRDFPHGSTVAFSPWILVSVGVVAMMVLLVIAATVYRAPGPEFDPGPPEPPRAAPPLPAERASSTGQEQAEAAAPAVPGLSPRRTDLPNPSATLSALPEPSVVPEPPSGVAPPPQQPSTRAPAAPPPAAPPPAAPPLEARYQVIQTFPGGFIGELSIRNVSRADLDWEARVAYPGGRVVTAWLEGVPQGTFRDRRGTLTYRSGPNLAAGSSVLLRFHIESAGSRPASCAVSGRSCILR